MEDSPLIQEYNTTKKAFANESQKLFYYQLEGGIIGGVQPLSLIKSTGSYDTTSASGASYAEV